MWIYYPIAPSIGPGLKRHSTEVCVTPSVRVKAARTIRYLILELIFTRLRSSLADLLLSSGTANYSSQRLDRSGFAERFPIRL